MSLTDIAPSQSINSENLNGTTTNENIFPISVNILLVKKRFDFKCEISDTVDSIKAKIQAETDIPPHQQKLFYDDELLKGDRTLAGERYTRDTDISVEFLEERTFTFNNSDTIDNVKAKIQEEVGMPHDEQTLVFEGELLEVGGRTLADYQIGMGSTIRLIRHGSMKIYINTLTGENWTLYVESWNAIEDVMKKICDEFGIPTSNQRLIFGGKALHQGNTLAHYNIEKESTLVLVQRLRGGGGVSITIEPLLGKTLKLKVEFAGNPITEIPLPSPQQTVLRGGVVDNPATWWEYLFSFVTIKGYFEKFGLRFSWIWFGRKYD